MSGSGVIIQDQGSQFTCQGSRVTEQGLQVAVRGHESGSKAMCWVLGVIGQCLRTSVGLRGQGLVSKATGENKRSCVKKMSKVTGQGAGWGLRVRVPGQGQGLQVTSEVRSRLLGLGVMGHSSGTKIRGQVKGQGSGSGVMV